MTAPGWLTRSQADVPADDDWLSARERAVLAKLRIEKRRADWRLGRLAAKAAVGAWLGAAPDRVEVLAAADGSPQALIDGGPAPAAVSISHRGGRALAAVAPAAVALGCDLELLEPRSEGFVEDWLSTPERELLESVSVQRRPLAANLVWAVKEAAAKARREGLRLDVRNAVARPQLVAEPAEAWCPLELVWDGGRQIAGWWREEPNWVMTVVADPPPAIPRTLD